MNGTQNPSFSFNEYIKIFNSTLEPSVQHHLRLVYTCLTMSALVAAAGSCVYLFMDVPCGNIALLSILNMFAAIRFLFILLVTPYESGKNVINQMSPLLGFAFCSGFSLGRLLERVIAINPAIIPTALLGTSVILACFTLCSLLSPRGQHLFLGAPLLSMLLLLITMLLTNIILESYLIFNICIFVAFVITCGLVLYDTRLIINRRRMGDEDYVRHSFLLFIDFFNILRYLMMFLSEKKDNNKCQLSKEHF